MNEDSSDIGINAQSAIGKLQKTSILSILFFYHYLCFGKLKYN